jgi:hypothetical protein
LLDEDPDAKSPNADPFGGVFGTETGTTGVEPELESNCLPALGKDTEELLTILVAFGIGTEE